MDHLGTGAAEAASRVEFDGLPERGTGSPLQHTVAAGGGSFYPA